MPLLSKPPGCSGCALEHRGSGFAPADGPRGAWLLLVGEALGKVEALTGRPFMGDAGGMLSRLLTLLGWSRDAIRIHNAISCQPPGDWFDERAPWYHAALAHCPYLAQTLDEGPEVVVTMGGTALRRVMGFQHHKKIRVQDFHGAILRDPTNRFWVVPTFHPSFLQRGAHNLIGTVLWDLHQAEAARHGKPADAGQLVIDPPVEWFAAWVDQVVAARTQDPGAYPLTSDVETPDKAGGKDEGEITAEDRSFQILRQNFACHPDEGVTVPHVEPYTTHTRRLYASPGAIWQWNREYDHARLVAAGQLREADSPRVVDLMWLAHFLQSDLPLGLGFWAPFYSGHGPWKHLADSQPTRYGAIDGLQNHRIGFGILTDLQKLGIYAQALRHTHQLHTTCLRPAQLVGVKIDRQRLVVFKGELADKAREKLQAIQAIVPEALQPLTPKGGLTKKPLAGTQHAKASRLTRTGKPRKGKPTAEIKQELYAQAQIVEKIVLKEVLVCRTCGIVDVQRRHRCAPPQMAAIGRVEARRRGRDQQLDPGSESPTPPNIELAPASVTRYFWQEPFNPDSPPQVLAYIKARRHTPGRAKKTGADSTDRETLKRLSKTGDPFYATVLDYRAINKVKGTYVEGTERRLDAEDRLHPQPTFRPSTQRLSYVNPNITNVVADKDEQRNLAAGFRRCVVATPGCQLIEIDFSAIEAKETGWCARDPFLIRLAGLGIHSYLIALRVKDAPDLSADDATIRAHLKAIKQQAGTLLYDQVKHTVYGVFYGQTPYGLAATWPDLYPSVKLAEEHVDFMFSVLPAVRTFQHAVLDTAAHEHQLGGAQPYAFTPEGGPSPRVHGHPYQYRHWFWSIYTYRRLNATQYFRAQAKAQQQGKAAPVAEIHGQYFRIAHGPDANRAIAFYPQSIASGVLKEALLRLFAAPDHPHYLGDAYFGQTPLRAPIHDSLFLEVPFRQVDRVLETVAAEMQAPILQQPNLPEWGMGAHLQIGVAAKVGADWQAMEDRPVRFGASPLAQAIERLGTPAEASDEEEWEELGRVV
jgi:uracil-DNA glycosylase family 4